MTMRESDYWTWKDNLTEALVKGGHIRNCSAACACDDEVAHALQDENVATVLKQVDCDQLIRDLREYGVWDEDELQCEADNFARIVWLLSCDWREEHGD